MDSANNNQELKIIFENQARTINYSKIQITEYNKKHIQNYESTARTLIIGTWIYDLIGALFAGYVEDKEIEISTLARETYNKKLAFRHSWIIRTPALWAMGLINKRQKFN